MGMDIIVDVDCNRIRKKDGWAMNVMCKRAAKSNF